MANEEVTTSLNIDITQFKKALTDANRYIRMANSEFDKATAGTERWTDSADGLRAKISQLSKTLDAQEAAAAALRLEYDRVVEEQGESSKGAQELAIKLNKQEAACKKTAAAIKKYEGDLENAESNTQETEKATKEMSGAFDKAAKAAGTLTKKLAGFAGKAVINSIKGIATASAGLVTAFLATGEAQKEHITEMAKLDAAYKSAGHSTKTAAKTYKELYSVIGETDQAVEASQQIALLADSEKDAAKWAEMGAGVVGKFGDALQPETFFEAANETMKLGESTGAYTQMLEGCGLSVDEFNKGLAACKTEGEKQAYMLATTQKALGSAGEEYRKANAAVIENNKANAKFQETLDGVGKAALPVMTALKLIGASVLGDLLPHIKTLGTSFSEALGGSKTAAADMGNAVAGILQQLGQKIVKALPTILTVGTSIITSLVQGIISAAPTLASGVGQIVQTFMQAAPQLLAAGGQMIQQLLNGIVSNIPAMLQGAVSAVGGFVQGLQTYLPIILAKGGELLGKLGEGIKTALPGLVSQGLDIIMNFAQTLYDAAPKLIDIGFNLLSDLVSGIMSALPVLISKGPEIISKFANIINDNFPKILKKGVELIGQIVKGIISAIPTLIANIPKIITAIVDVWQAFNWLQLGKNAIKFLGNGIKSMLGAVKSAGSNVLNAVTNAIKSLPSKLLQLGKQGISNMRSGISSMIGSIRSAGSSVLNAVVSAIQSLPGKLLAFGRNAITSLGNAIQVGVTTVKSKATSIVNGMVNAFQSLPGKMVQIGKDAIQGVINGIGAMVGKLYDSIKNALGGLVDKAKDALGIASPSKIMRDMVGRWIPAGIAAGIEKYSGLANDAMVDMARGAVNSANAELSGASLNMPDVNGGGAPGTGRGRSGAVYNFYQYNTSPKALSRKDVYRQTKNALKFATSNA